MAVFVLQVTVISDVSMPLAAASCLELQSHGQLCDSPDSSFFSLPTVMLLVMICVMVLTFVACCLARHHLGSDRHALSEQS
jgi:hypothetical protein